MVYDGRYGESNVYSIYQNHKIKKYVTPRIGFNFEQARSKYDFAYKKHTLGRIERLEDVSRKYYGTPIYWYILAELNGINFVYGPLFEPTGEAIVLVVPELDFVLMLVEKDQYLV